MSGVHDPAHGKNGRTGGSSGTATQSFVVTVANEGPVGVGTLPDRTLRVSDGLVTVEVSGRVLGLGRDVLTSHGVVIGTRGGYGIGVGLGVDGRPRPEVRGRRRRLCRGRRGMRACMRRGTWTATMTGRRMRRGRAAGRRGSIRCCRRRWRGTGRGRGRSSAGSCSRGRW